ncbi:hypothetical protein BC835DRAFT_1270857 [Cytidiella melzeri]|nr:hypothetical protein BC835DRAFT_1270857 [Cytidiella melzeri]
MGTITAPTPDATISDTFAFAYSIDNWCEEGYNNFKVFASQSASAPTVADLDSNGDVPNALASWGDYTVANFGLTPLGTQPPSSLEMPSLDDIDTSDCVPMFITVVETFNGCPVS